MHSINRHNYEADEWRRQVNGYLVGCLIFCALATCLRKFPSTRLDFSKDATSVAEEDSAFYCDYIRFGVRGDNHMVVSVDPDPLSTQKGFRKDCNKERETVRQTIGSEEPDMILT